MTPGPGRAELSTPSDLVPGDAAVAVGAHLGFRRRRRVSRDRLMRAAVPYALLSPASLVIGAVLAYPLYFLVKLSFQHYGLSELIRHSGTWNGVDNYTSIIHDSLFWRV